MKTLLTEGLKKSLSIVKIQYQVNKIYSSGCLHLLLNSIAIVNVHVNI